MLLPHGRFFLLLHCCLRVFVFCVCACVHMWLADDGGASYDAMETGSTTSRARLNKQSYVSNRSSTGYAASETSDISAGPEKWRRVRRGECAVCVFCLCTAVHLCIHLVHLHLSCVFGFSVDVNRERHKIRWPVNRRRSAYVCTYCSGVYRNDAVILLPVEANMGWVAKTWS